MKKSNWPIIILLIIAVGLGLVFGYYQWIQPEEAVVGLSVHDTRDAQSSTTNWSIPDNITNVSTTLPIKYSESVYAVKDKKQVTVKKRNIITGVGSDLFSYNEVDDASESARSGNTWDGLSPNIALSHGRTKLAYMATDGLNIRDLSSDTTRTIIRNLTPAAINAQLDPKPQTWSASEMTGVYILALPNWSYDDSYVGFVEALSEGSLSSAITAETKIYQPFTSDQSDFPQKRLAVSGQPIVWSPVSLAGIIPGNDFGYSTPGLFITKSDNFGSFTRLTIDKAGDNTKSFIEAAYSPDGQTLAYTTREVYDGPASLFIVGIDGSNNSIIRRNADIYSPFFSADGSKLYFVQRLEDVNQLEVYNFENYKTETVAILPPALTTWSSPSWTSEGYLSLVGLVRENLARAGKTNQLFLLDLSSKSVIYASPISEMFTSYLGYI